MMQLLYIVIVSIESVLPDLPAAQWHIYVKLSYTIFQESCNVIRGMLPAPFKLALMTYFDVFDQCLNVLLLLKFCATSI